MDRFRGGGVFLVLILLVLLYAGYRYIGGVSERATGDEFRNYGQSAVVKLSPPLAAYFREHQKVPVTGDVDLPPVPPAHGVRAWTLGADGVVTITTDARAGRRQLQVKAVPVVLPYRQGVRYQLTADAGTLAALSMEYLKMDDPALKTSDDIPKQLAENQIRLKDPAGRNTTDQTVVRSHGLVVAVPDDNSRACGEECLQQVSCASERPLVCGDAHRLQATRAVYRGTDLPRHADARAACQREFGRNSSVAGVANVLGTRPLDWGQSEAAARAAARGSPGTAPQPKPRVSELAPGRQYWVDSYRDQRDLCWVPSPAGVVER